MYTSIFYIFYIIIIVLVKYLYVLYNYNNNNHNNNVQYLPTFRRIDLAAVRPTLPKYSSETPECYTDIEIFVIVTELGPVAPRNEFSLLYAASEDDRRVFFF